MVKGVALRGMEQIWLAVLIFCLLLLGLYSYTEGGCRTFAPLPLRYSTTGDTTSLRIQPLSLNSSLTNQIWNLKMSGIEQIYLLQIFLRKEHFFNYTNVEILKIELRRKMGSFFKNRLVVDRQNTPRNYKFVFGSKAKSQVWISGNIYKLLPNKVSFGEEDIPRCSVVGNGGLILNSRCGKDIDKADFVFRCNAAPIKAFANDAGNKTNFTSINPSVIRNRYRKLPMRERRSRFLKDMKEYRGLVWAPCFTSAEIMRECLNVVKTYKISENKFVLAYPSHLKKVQDFWISCGLEKRISTGLYLVTLALSYCREVHLFGFWPFSNMVDKTIKDVPYHYFDKVQYNFSDKSATHDMQLEFSVLLQLHNLGVLKLHVGECSH